jgi:hypothetical protein
MANETQPPPWLLLVHQLPPKPTSVRVKTWRRLLALGAVAIKNSVYVLPYSARAREDLEWVKSEILALGGEATIFAADSPGDLGHRELVDVFHRAREQDYRRLDSELERLRARGGGRAAARGAKRLARERAVRALRRRFDEIARSDFFACPAGRATAAGLAAMERGFERAVGADPGHGLPPLAITTFQDRRWVTRPLPGVDRMASAWLIRRFVDPAAVFVFASTPDAEPGAVPFDMFGGEFSHHGDNCTFETLQERFGLRARALVRIGEIVHDCDLNDRRYCPPEAIAIERLVHGLRLVANGDAATLENGILLFEALYRSFSAEANPVPVRRPRSTAHPRRQRTTGPGKGRSRSGH